MPDESPPAVSDAVRALSWSAAIERSGATRAHRRVLPWRAHRTFRYDDRVAVAESVDATAPFPTSRVFVDPVTGESELTRPDRPSTRSRAIADVVVAGTMRSAEQLRFRAFYVSTGSPRSLAVHQRFEQNQPTPLAQGVGVQSAVRGRTPFVVPRILDTGQAHVEGPRPGSGRVGRAVVADWVVEEALDGEPVKADAAEATTRELIALLAQTWRALGVDHAPLPADQRDRALAAFAELVTNAPDGIWPAGLDREAIGRRGRDLLAASRLLTIGVSHGDPGLGNVLRLPDGRLALIDWEDAGQRLVAHDVVKVLMSAPNPASLAATLDPPAEFLRAAATAGAAPWSGQVATALLVFLSGWRHRHLRAVKRGSTAANRRRMHAQLTTLATLLDD